MWKKNQILLFTIVGVALVLFGCIDRTNPLVTENPPYTDWRPVGARSALAADIPNKDKLPNPAVYHGLHVDTHNSDAVWRVAAPKYKEDWTVHGNLYVPEGVVFDDEGNIYFSPMFPDSRYFDPKVPGYAANTDQADIDRYNSYQYDISMISIDGKTGKTRWTVKGDGVNGSGNLLALLNPDYDPRHDKNSANFDPTLTSSAKTRTKKILYFSSYIEAMAINTLGETIWRVSTDTLPFSATDPSVLVDAIRDHLPRKLLDFQSWSLNYHPQTDAVVGATKDGRIYAFRRADGVALTPLLDLRVTADLADPKVNFGPKMQTYKELAQGTFDAIFGSNNSKFPIHGDTQTVPKFGSFLGWVVDTTLGVGGVSSNYFSIDANTGRIFVATTQPREGSELETDFGVIYVLEIVADTSAGATHSHKISIWGHSWQGGTNAAAGPFPALDNIRANNAVRFPNQSASTPALTSDGTRMLIADGVDTVYAFDTTQLGANGFFKFVWKQNIGEQVIGSVGISADNREYYVAGRNNMFKIVEQETIVNPGTQNQYTEYSAHLPWPAFPGRPKGAANIDNAFDESAFWGGEFNAQGANIAANGVYAYIGVGMNPENTIGPGGINLVDLEDNLLIQLGIGVVDKETGRLNSFATIREESISGGTIAPDGSYIVANSPLRRVIARAIPGVASPLTVSRPITGGISRVKPYDYTLIARDAACSARDRALNTATLDPVTQADAVAADLQHLEVLLDQSEDTLHRAATEWTETNETYGVSQATLALLKPYYTRSRNYLNERSLLQFADTALDSGGLGYVCEYLNPVDTTQ